MSDKNSTGGDVNKGAQKSLETFCVPLFTAPLVNQNYKIGNGGNVGITGKFRFMAVGI